MKTVHSRVCSALAISLSLTACGESTQFREIPIDGPIFVEDNPEMATLPETNQGKSETTTNNAYAGDETEAPEAAAGAWESTPPAVSPAPTPAPAPAPTPAPTPAPAGLFTDCDETPNKGIVAELYEVPVNTAQLPNFDTLSALRTVCLSQLNIKDRQFSEGFPGVTDLFEWFALDMQFRVLAPKAGLYEFSLAADDGAILWIDGAQVINNDGLHQVKTVTAKVNLAAGQHNFRVAYYQGPRWRIALELFWKIPGNGTRVHIPASVISRMP